MNHSRSHASSIPVPKSASTTQSIPPSSAENTQESPEGLFSLDPCSFDADYLSVENCTPKETASTRLQPPWMSEGYHRPGKVRRFMSQDRIPSFLGPGGYDFIYSNSSNASSNSSSSSSGSGGSGNNGSFAKSNGNGSRIRSKLGTLSYNNTSMHSKEYPTPNTTRTSPTVAQDVPRNCSSAISLGPAASVATPPPPSLPPPPPLLQQKQKQQMPSYLSGADTINKTTGGDDCGGGNNVGSVRQARVKLRRVNEELYDSTLKKVGIDSRKARYSIADKSPSAFSGLPSTIGFKRAWDEFCKSYSFNKRQKTSKTSRQ